jgi:hypothetical protein
MKERVIVNYIVQNDKNDTSINSFFLVVDNPKKVTVRQILNQFPARLNSCDSAYAYHLRFLDSFGGKTDSESYLNLSCGFKCG